MQDLDLQVEYTIESLYLEHIRELGFDTGFATLIPAYAGTVFGYALKGIQLSLLRHTEAIMGKALKIAS